MRLAGDAAQQGIELLCAEGGYFAVQDNGDSLTCQLQPSIHLDDAGKLFHGIVGIVYGEVPDKAGRSYTSLPCAALTMGRSPVIITSGKV